MIKLEKILNNIISESELITEGVMTPNKVIDIMNNRQRINIWYDSGDGQNTGKRTIDIYAYGLTKAGNRVIRAFQPFGDTKTKKPAWKFFILDKIIKMEPTNFKIYSPISDLSQDFPKWNENGDKSMSTVYKIINFDDIIKKNQSLLKRDVENEEELEQN
jgi:hypothetical protein